MALGAQRKSVLFLMIQGEMSAVMLGAFLGVLFSLGMIHVYVHLAHHGTPPSNGRLVEKVGQIGEQSCRLLLGDEMTAALDPERP